MSNQHRNAPLVPPQSLADFESARGELKRLAAEANAITLDVSLKLIAEGVSQAEADAVVRFHAAANPAAILVLLAAQDEVVTRADSLVRECGREASAYKIQGADLLRRVERQQIEVEVLCRALESCADDLECSVLSQYHGQAPADMHPVTRRSFDQDMAGVTAARSAVAAAIARTKGFESAKPHFPDSPESPATSGAQPKPEFPTVEDASGLQGQEVTP